MAFGELLCSLPVSHGTLALHFETWPPDYRFRSMSPRMHGLCKKKRKTHSASIGRASLLQPCQCWGQQV